MMIATAYVTRIDICVLSRSAKRRMKQNSIAQPRMNISGTVISRPGSSPIPRCVDSVKLR